MVEAHNLILAGKKALVVGIANERSIAWPSDSGDGAYRRLSCLALESVKADLAPRAPGSQISSQRRSEGREMTGIGSTRWARALVVAGLGLTLRGASPAYAEEAARPDQTGERARPLPAPGTSRLIRIGPEMVVREDDHGRVTMAAEPAAKPKNRGRGMIAIFLGILTAGAVLTLGRNELSRDVGEPVAR